MNINRSVEDYVGIYYCNLCDQKWYSVRAKPDMYKKCMKCDASYIPKQWYSRIKKCNYGSEPKS